MKIIQLFIKGLVIAMLFTPFFNLNAQTVSTAFAAEINRVFSGVDKNRVPHSLLLDYGMEFTELSAYNGTLSGDNLTHAGHYTAIYNTLLMARVQTGVPGLHSPDTFDSNWNDLRNPGKIVLSGLYYKYSKFRDDAHPDYITISGDRLYDKYVDGVWQDPYEEQQVFAVATPILKYNDLSVDVELPAALWYTNRASEVAGLAIDFGDGRGYRAVAFGQSLSISYANPGIYEWKYKLSLTGGQVLYSHSKIQIDGTPDKPPLMARQPSEPCTNPSGIDEVEFTGTRTYLGQANEAILEIDYANNDCTIRKPLIVVEGFDSGLLGVENPLGENFYTDFVRDAIDNTGALPSQLFTYDIIYVNWNNGRDYMQRNAALLKDIIDWVNDTKAGSTPNVVLGQSMGGVIARYALADMELDNQDHHTSLFISHDAPQQGANVPIGILYFARHMVDQFVSTPIGDANVNISGTGGPVTLEDVKDLLDAPGTRQLLKYSVAPDFSKTPDWHDDWQAELQSKGYPQLTRNIALSNGSHCAETQAFNPGDLLFSLEGEGKTSLLTDLIMHLWPITDLGYIALAVLFDEPALLVGVIPGNSKFDMEFKAYALPPVGPERRIYKGKIDFIKKILWLINLRVNITDREYNSLPGMLSYDYYPGGKYEPLFDFNSSSANGLLGSYDINAYVIDDFDFIPTPSALDVGSTPSPLGNNDYLKVYSAANPPTGSRTIPFHNFTTSYNTTGNNEEHISFNTRNGDWLAEELDGDSNNGLFDCSYVCDSPDNVISGSGTLCSSGVYSVRINGDATVNWSVSDTRAVSLSSTTGSPVTLTATRGYRTTITLTATISSTDCGASVSLTRSIRVGAPGTPSYIFGPSSVNTGATVTYYAGASEGATGYRWYLPYPYSTVRSFDYWGDYWQLQSPGTGSSARTFTGWARTPGYVQVMGTNACGTGGARSLYVTHTGGGGGGGRPGDGDPVPCCGGGIASARTQAGTTAQGFKVAYNPNTEDIRTC